jgi:hypothetical protein
VSSQTQLNETSSLPPRSLFAVNPLRWLAIFGPGAVIASLTIGVGELVFSARAGALFGYRLLWFFVLVLILKWTLVFASARHIVLTGAHPFQRWMELPGPRGWLPLVFFLLAVPVFPIWVFFHSGTLGTLLGALTGTAGAWHGSAHLVWGMGALTLVMVLCFSGGYATLEKAQLWIVVLMLASVGAAVFFVNVDWLALLKGLFVPQAVEYPPWINAESHAEVAKRSAWLETTTYVGVIGGSSYDYLAYVSYLRDKRWGRAGDSLATADELQEVARNSRHATRLWLRAPLVDCTLSFLAVLVFCAVFVICGAAVLGPQHKVPAGANLLSLQAEFVAAVHPGLKLLYFVGAFLAVFGTLYGTMEVAPTVLRELVLAVRPQLADAMQARLRRWSVAWVGAGGLVILLWSFGYHLRSGADKPPGLIAILTPANLFTGVLGCGIVCALNIWMDQRFLPRGLRMHWLLLVLSGGGAMLFVVLGLKAYLEDRSGVAALCILFGTLGLGLIGASLLRRREGRRPPA